MERLNELELANAALEKEVEDLKKIIQAGKLNNDSGRIAENHKHLRDSVQERGSLGRLISAQL